MSRRAECISEGAPSPRNEDQVDDDLLLGLIDYSSAVLDALHDQVWLGERGRVSREHIRESAGAEGDAP